MGASNVLIPVEVLSLRISVPLSISVSPVARLSTFTDETVVDSPVPANEIR